jgi:chloramphenicol 3-O phosphotransferase
MSQVIFLSGCSSAGKTLLAKSIQHLSYDLWVSFGVNTFINLLPLEKQEAYFKFILGQNQRGPTVQVQTGQNAGKIFGMMPKFAEILANAGNNLIIDEVLLDDSSLRTYARSLANHTVYYIGVFCDLKIMQELEILRGDRAIGLANDQIERVHQGIRGSYDLKVETSLQTPFKVAHEILEFLSTHPTPPRFKKIIGEDKA